MSTTFYDRVKNTYASLHHVTMSSSLLSAQERSRLHHEMVSNTYVLPTLSDMIATATSYTCFDAPTIQLRVVGNITPLDVRTCIKVCRRVTCIQALYPTTPARLIVWLFLTTPKRYMPKSGPVEPIHINGGYTYIKGNEIYVLRREEFPKVILHEVIHHTSLHKHTWDPSSLKALYRSFDISEDACGVHMHTCSTRLEPNEAVVEAWAEMFHMAFLSIEYGIPFDAIYKTEMEHAFQQSRKLLRYQHKAMPKWREGSHAYAYIVIRTILLYTFEQWHTLHSRDTTRVILETFHNPRYREHIRTAKITDRTSLRMTWFGDM